MQLQNYQEKLLAPVPSHPRASLSNPYRLHLIPLLLHGACRGTNFRLSSPASSHHAHSLARTNEKASLTIKSGLVSRCLAAHAINQIYCQSYLQHQSDMLKKGNACHPHPLFLSLRLPSTNAICPVTAHPRSKSRVAGPWLLRYTMPHIRTRAQVSRSVRDRERSYEKR